MATKIAAVSVDKQALADLRSQIDQVDGVIHDMLRERAEIIDQVRKIKGKQQIYIRPGREAQMMRALMGRLERGPGLDALVDDICRGQSDPYSVCDDIISRFLTKS